MQKYSDKVKSAIGEDWLLCLALTGLFFSVTGIQYWVTDYLVIDLGSDEAKVQITFGIVSITGPMLRIATVARSFTPISEDIDQMSVTDH